VIAHYNDDAPPPGPDRLPKTMSTLEQKRILVRGLIILDHYADRFDAFRRDMGQWVAADRVRLREDVVDGLENAPAAFIGLLEGRNFGKLLVRVVAE
jgi:NADPH-dependent curcumin reductase CurA